MAEEIRALLARHLPRYDVRSIAKLGEGLDNLVYEVNGELIVRQSKDADRESVRREAELLAVVGGLATLPVPEVIFADDSFLAYRKLPGVPLLGHPLSDPARLAAPLAGFVGGLHAAALTAMEALVPRDDDPLTTWLEDASQAYLEIAEVIPRSARRHVEDFLGRTPPEEPPAMVFCHNDLGSEHLLVDVDANVITGVIDWTDAAIADAVHDFARIYRDLGPEVFDLMVARYDGDLDDAARERALFYARCTLLEDIAFGVSTGAGEYTEAGLAHLARTFA